MRSIVDHSKSGLFTWVGPFSATFSLPFFDFDFDFEFTPDIAAAALGFSRVTPGANASRGASSGTTKNALISNLGDTEADSGDRDSAT